MTNHQVRSRPRLARTVVLVVDDDPPLRRAVANMLRGTGATVREAGSREQALAVAGFETIDVVIMDIQVGKEDGLKIARELVGIHPAAQAIYMSGAARPVELGAHERFLAKPFIPADLLAAVRDMAPLQAGDRA